MGRGCPLLRSINISNCQNVTPVGVMALAQGCPLLVRINLDFCDRISDESVIALAHGCPLLRRIDLFESNMSDNCVSTLRVLHPLLKICKPDY